LNYIAFFHFVNKKKKYDGDVGYSLRASNKMKNLPNGSSMLAIHWQQTNCDEPNWCSRADINQSGFVDLSDLNIIADNWLAGL